MLLLLAPAISADADHAQQVLSQLKSVFRGHRILNSFQLGRIEFNDLSALRTDHVIVMLMLVVVLVMRATITEANLAREAGISQQSQRAIDRRLLTVGSFSRTS